MKFLNIWRLRSVRFNWSYAATTVLAVVFFFAMMTWTTLFLDGFCRSTIFTDGDGLLRKLIGFAQSTTTLSCALMLYNSFAFSVLRQQDEHWILYSNGATGAQFLGNFFSLALWLDLAGLVFGIPLGILVLRLMMNNPRTGAVDFTKELEYIQTQPAILFYCVLPALIVVPLMLFCSTWFILPNHNRHSRNAYRADELFRPTLTRLIFGIGGEYASLSRRRRAGPRKTLLISFVLVMTVLAGMKQTLWYFGKEANLRVDSKDASVSFYAKSHTNDESFLNELESFVSLGSDQGMVNHAVICRYYKTDSYCMLNRACVSRELSDAQRRISFVPIDSKYNTCFPFRENKVALYCPDIAFLNNEAYRDLTLAVGAAPDENGAILYNVVLCRGGYVPLLSEGAQTETILCIKPNTDFASGKASDKKQEKQKREKEIQPIHAKSERLDIAEYVRQTEDVCVRKPVHIIGETKEDSGNLFKGVCTLVFPENRRAEFADALRGYEQEMMVNLKTDASYTEFFYDSLKENALKHKDCKITAHRFGTGTEHIRRPANTATELDLVNYVDAEKNLKEYQNQTDPLFFYFFLVLSVLLLIANIVNVLHMSRGVQQREKITLETIGIQKRHRIGMLLYESTLYSVRCTLISILAFFILYPMLYEYTLIGLSFERLNIHNLAKAIPDIPWYQLFWVLHRQIFAGTWDAFQRNWQLFIVMAALIFVAYFIVNNIETRRSTRAKSVMVLREEQDD